MKLHELVNLRNMFKNMTQYNLTELNSNYLETINHFLSIVDHKGFIDSSILSHDNLSKLEVNLSRIDWAFKDVIEKLDNEIDRRAEPFYNRDLDPGEFVLCGTANVELERLRRIMPTKEAVKNEISSRIVLHTTPRHPSLEIGPGDGQWTPLMVAADPLYLVDIHPEFIESTKRQFTEAYQRRLRTYLNDWDGYPGWDLSFLPQNQFEFVFAWNVFDFYQLDFIEKYLDSIFNVLAPGGSALFSFNNCDFPANAKFAETGFKAWATEKSIVNLCKRKGFEITFIKTIDIEWSYIEIKKPGILKSVKTTQALGEIRNYGT